MASNGLSITMDEFESLRQKQQNRILFENLKEQGKDLKEIKSMLVTKNFKDYGYAIWLFILTVAIGMRKYIPILD